MVRAVRAVRVVQVVRVVRVVRVVQLVVQGTPVSGCPRAPHCSCVSVP